MGQVYLTNVTGRSVKVTSFVVNDANICLNTDIESGGTFRGNYNGDKEWNQYTGLELNVALDQTNYKVNLNKDHYFAGGDYHYPGKSSDVDFVLMGVDTSNKRITFLLGYRQSGTPTLTFASDTKYLDIV